MPRMSIAFPKDREDAKKIQNKPIDESVATPSDGDILVYRDAGADWVLESKPAGGSNPAINDVTDVTITTPADNEVLAYDSTSGNWINQTAAEAGLQPVLAEGAFVDGDKTKLSGIETGADVTDTANVTAAGALMDSEVDADIKTLSLPANTTISTFGASLVDDADASAARTTLGVDASGTVNATLTKSITIESPDNAEDISMFYTPIAITVTEMVAVLVGSSTPSVTWTVRHSTDRSAVGNEVVTSGTTTTSTTTGSVVTSFNDATIPANSFVWVETSASSGTVNSIQISVEYTED